jgi:hypothetical protein
MKHATVYYTCDFCDKQVEAPIRVMITIGDTMDASGNGYETSMKEIELCPICLDKIIQTCYDQGYFQFKGLPKKVGMV